MATLTGKKIKNTYDALLKVDDNNTVSSTAKQITDGLGNSTPLYISTTQIGIGVTPSFQLHTSGNAKIGGNLIVAGNLTVNGSTTIIDSTIVAIGDNMIEMAKDNIANTKDIGWYGTIVESGTKYAGMAYDASTGVTAPKFNLGLGTVEPGNTFATTVIGTLIANLEGNVTGTVSSLSNHTTDNLTEGTNLYYTNARADARVDLQTGANLDLSNKDTDDLSEGTTNLYFTTTRARASFTEGTGVTITDGEIAIGQAVATTSNVNFNRITSSEDLRFDGTNTRLRSDNEFDFLTTSGQAQSLRTLGVSAQTTYNGNSAASGMFNALNGYAVGTGTGTTVIDSSRNLTNIGTGNFSGQVTIPETPTADAHAASKKYVDDSIPTATTPALSAVLATGNTSGANDLLIADDQKLLLGDDSDFEIFKFGAGDNFIRSNTGHLYLQIEEDDHDMFFQGDDGAGGKTTYFFMDGSEERTKFLKKLEIVDNNQLILGSNDNSYLKWDSTASQLFISGDSKFLNSAYVVNNLNVQKSVYQTATGGFYINKPYGADFYTTTNNYTGAIQIALPTGGTGHDDMIKFVVDIFDYDTQACVTVFIGGYTYQNVGTGNNTWTNPSATVLGQSASQNYTVRFGDNGTEHCVWIGDTTSTWNHLQVIVRDFFAGYTANINNYLGGFGISVDATQATVNNTLTNCFPMSSDTITGYLPLTGGTVTGNVLLGSNTNISMDASANGQLMIDGVGYQGAIALDENAMHIYHNSSGRSLVLGTNETARLTISGSGNASFTGTVTAPNFILTGTDGFNLPSGGFLDWANGDARIVEGLVNNYSLSFQTWDGSALSTALRLDGDNTATFSGGITSDTLSAASIGVSGSNGTDGKGISLYAGANSGEPTYGMMFMQTSSYGTFGYVSGDWATYFTMNSSSNRGWIFRKVGVGNVASINNNGHAHFQTPTKITSNDTSLTFEDAGTNAIQIKVGAGDELYIGGNNTYQFRGTTTGQAQLNSAGYVKVIAGASNYTGFVMHQTDGSRVGYFYGDDGGSSTPNIGILDSDGNWAVRVIRDTYTELRVNNSVKLQTTTAINYNLQATWIEGGSANWNETTPGTTTGSLHLDPGSGTDHFGSAITFGASDSGAGTSSNAGIYTRSDGSYGTKMYFATTDSYATGSKTRMMIDYNGYVGVNTTNPLSQFVVSEGTNQHGIELAPGTLSYLQCYDRGTSTYGNMTIDTYHLRFGLNNGGEKIRFTEYGQILINAQSSGFGSNGYGYNFGVRGTNSQAFISIARANQTLDTQGIIIGLDTNHSYFISRDALPIEFHTNNGVRMHIHGSLNRVGIGGDPVSVAGVNNFLMVKGSAHSGIVLNDTDVAQTNEIWNDGGNLRVWDQIRGYKMQLYSNGNAEFYYDTTSRTFGVAQSSGTTGQGISLYGGASSGEPTYGMMFMQTATFGGYGLVNGSWATYFTMNNDNARGWIFRKVGNSNCASISGAGDLSLNGQINFPNSNMRILGAGSSSYLRIQSGSASDSGIELKNTSSVTLGYFYGNTSQLGIYNKDGYNLLKATPGAGGVTTIYKGNGITKIEAGDNINLYHNTGYTQFNSNGYIYTQSWINLGGGAGIYSGTNGAHFYPNNSGSYATWRIDGSRNSYTGINMSYGGVNIGMYDSGGNGGDYNTSTGWHYYYNRTNLCLGIGGSNTSSSYSLYVTGSIYSTADVIAYSDKRAKENIVTVDSAIEKVNKLRGVYYTPKEGDDKSRKVGVIAQEILEVLPEVVTHDKENDRYGVDYGKITGLLIEAIKDQQKQIDKLNKFVDKLNK